MEGAAAVLLTPEKYDQIQEELRLLDDLELARLLKEAGKAKSAGKTISHTEVKKILKIK